ncbi:MAG: hypothetical protein IPM14_14120 [bacterium]|nr:hypothetical protein [bacterium]
MLTRKEQSDMVLKMQKEIIVTTDADCIHDEEWLNSLMQSFDPVTGFVSGPVEFER